MSLFALLRAPGRKRVKVCTDGTAGPYILCDPQDLNEVRRFLREHEFDTSFDPTAITDGGTKAHKAMGSLINVPDLKQNQVKGLQKELDEKFPYDN